MNFLNFVIIFSFSFLSGMCLADCTESDKKVIYDCYNTHLNFYNYTHRIYEHIFTMLRFTEKEAKTNCTIFEALGNCIGEERWNTCVTPESLSSILGKSVDDARDLIYIYGRYRIFCIYLPEIAATYMIPGYNGGEKHTGCYDSASINSCAYDRLSHRKYYSPNDCSLFPSYLNCSLPLIAYRCEIPYAKMHCDFMNHIISTYHGSCGLKPFNCTEINYLEERLIGKIEFTGFQQNMRNIGTFYSIYVDPIIRYSRFLYASVFVAIFYTTLKKNSPLKSSFFALFLLIPFYDTVCLVVIILQYIPDILNFMNNVGIQAYLSDFYITLMSSVSLVMSLNRFTAINFPLRHGKIWSPCVMTCIITVQILVIIIISVLDRFILNSANTSLTGCLFQRSLYCTFRENFDMGKVGMIFKWYRCLFNFFMCGLSVALLFVTIIRYQLCIKNEITDALKTAEKRLFLVTCVEVFLTVLYTIFSNYPVFVMNYQILYITLHARPVYLVHHFSTIALFFLFSKATRDAYFKFFYLDVFYKKIIKKYIPSRFKNDRIVAIPSTNGHNRRRTK